MSLRGVYRGPHGRLCTRGEKEHTSKRVSVIVSDNVISKAKLCDVYTRIFRTPKETSRGPQKILVLLGHKYIKFSPF